MVWLWLEVLRPLKPRFRVRVRWTHRDARVANAHESRDNWDVDRRTRTGV
jgi:hypothetical protein